MVKNLILSLPQEIIDKVLVHLLEGEYCQNNINLAKAFSSDFIINKFHKRNFERTIVELESRFLPILKGLKTDESNVKIYKNTMEKVYTRLNYLEYRLARLSEMDALIEKKMIDIQESFNILFSNINNGATVSGTINTDNTASVQSD